MADLLNTLLLPNSSQESFQSTRSRALSYRMSLSSSSPSPPPPPVASQQQRQDMPLQSRTLPPQLHQQQQQHPDVLAQQTPGVVLYDVHTYLSDPTNSTLLSSSSTTPTPTPTGPVQLGSPTSATSVSRFFELCQEKGFVPHFTIDDGNRNTGQSVKGQQGLYFTGTLTVGGETVTLGDGERGRSKKEVRQMLAEKGLPVLQGREGSVRGKRESDSGDMGGENWVGKLLDFHSSSPTTPPHTYTSFAHGLSFASECTLSHRPTGPFGGRTILFSTKKAAKNNAARSAVLWLIQEGHLAEDGSVKKKQKTAPPEAKAKAKATAPAPAPRNQRDSTLDANANANADAHPESDSEKSWPQRVNELCPLLGLTCPQYRLLPSDATGTIPNIYSGGAFFPTEPFVIGTLAAAGAPGAAAGGPVGEVRNVFGKRHAREECARGVWLFLDGVRRKRLGLREEDGVGFGGGGGGLV